jgi:hypothetical protein
LGAPGALTGDPNSAAAFVESGDRVEVPDDNALKLNGSFSIEFWSKVNSFTNSFPGFMRKGSSAATGTGYVLFYGSDLRPNFKRAGISRKISPAGALTSQFRQYVVTYDEPSGTLKWYVDGALDSTYTAMSFPDSFDATALNLGRGDHYGNHVLDDVSFYSSALSAGRVAAHNAAGDQVCSEIAEATEATYGVTSADAGSRLKVVVTATNAAGMESITSPASAVITPTASAPTARTTPKIEGDARRGRELTALRGAWRGQLPITYGYRWARCRYSTKKEKLVCSEIAGARARTYKTTRADLSYRLKVKVVASNIIGKGTAYSPPTKKIST